MLWTGRTSSERSAGYDPGLVDPRAPVSREHARQYEKFDLWYANEDGLFGKLGKYLPKGASPAAYGGRSAVLGGVEIRSTVENLRNPVSRIVEFYASTILSGDLEEALPFEASPGEQGKNPDNLKAAVEKVHEASNLSQTKQVLKRGVAKSGQMAIKVVNPGSGKDAYLQFIETRHVTDYETDSRGNCIYVRTDVPKTRLGAGGQEEKRWSSEVWRKGGPLSGDAERGKPGYVIFAETERTSDDTVPSEQRLRESEGSRVYELGVGGEGPLGGPTETGEEGGETGFASAQGFRFDFVPFVVINAQDTGEKRPKPVYAHALPLAQWINKEATRLSDLLFRFNKAFKAVVGIGNDPLGRPMPAPDVPLAQGARDLGRLAANGSPGEYDEGRLTEVFAGSRAMLLDRGPDISIDGVAVLGLPGNAQVVDIAPNIAYEAARQWISDHLRELLEECPELLYYATEHRANQSGTALRTLIAGALSRAEEMRSNIIAGLVKAENMALTIGQLASVEGFSEAEIGTFENGDFDHSYAVGDVLPLTEEEEQAAMGKKIENAQKLVVLGMSREAAMKQVGLEVEEGSMEEEPEGELDPEELREANTALQARIRGSTGRKPASPGEASAGG